MKILAWRGKRLAAKLCRSTAALSLAIVGSVSCGSRSQLLTEELCSEQGEARACSNACGAGQQVCAAGIWQPCAVPELTEGCTDQCGSGTRLCSQGSWSECEVPPVSVACSTVCGDGQRVCEHNTWKACDAPPPKPPRLIATIRDFHRTQPDFELPLFGNFSEKNLVKMELGDDGTPVYNTGVVSKTTSGAENFYDWYHTLGGSINRETTKEFQLTPSSSEPGLYVYSNDKFFPIDGELFGNEVYNHNFHFTLETKFSFRYIGGEVFRFTGDDDLWVFINGRRVMDLGGIHTSESATVALDAIAADAHLARGQEYPLSLFFAERHTWESHFTVETSIADPGTCE